MSARRTLLTIGEIVFTAITILAVNIMVATSRWLDAVLWATTILFFAASIWMDVKRRRYQTSLEHPTSLDHSKVGSAATIAGFLGLGAYGLATQFVPVPYAGLAFWLILPAYPLAYWVIVPASRRRYGVPFARKDSRRSHS